MSRIEYYIKWQQRISMNFFGVEISRWIDDILVADEEEIIDDLEGWLDDKVKSGEITVRNIERGSH